MRLKYSKYTLSRGLQKIKTKTAIMISAVGLIIGSGAGLAVATFGSAHAMTNYTLFGSASQQSDGVHLYSNGTQPYSGITLSLPAGTTVNDINDLQTSFQVITGTCGQGSPRFSMITPAGNIFVYVGDYPNYASCSSGPTGSLLSGPDLRVDTTQVGGTFYDSWAHAQTLVGSQPITELDIVVDGGSASSPQEFNFTSATVNTTVYNFVPPVLVGSVTGGLTLGTGTQSNPRQQISFNAFDYGPSSSSDYGTVEYQNFDYPGGLHYTASVQCVTVSGKTATFMFQIPQGHPGLSGLYVVASVTDGGSPGKVHDTYGHTATDNLATAMNWCEHGTSVTNYTITGGNAVVHKQ